MCWLCSASVLPSILLQENAIERIEKNRCETKMYGHNVRMSMCECVSTSMMFVLHELKSRKEREE